LKIIVINSDWYFYPVWVRLWHIVNAILILILIFTGISIFYREKSAFFFIMEYDGARVWHNVSSILLVISYIGFIAGNLVTDNGKHYRISEKNFLHDLSVQLRYMTTGFFRREKKPFPVTAERKFNPLQKLAYLAIMYGVFPLLVVSGIYMMLKGLPEVGKVDDALALQFDLVHIISGILITLFLFVHIYMAATLGSTPSSGLRSIISGYAETEE